MKILIAAPLRQRPEIFREYQSSLDRLEMPDGVTADRFFVVNDCPAVIPEIRNADYIVNDSENVTVYQNHLWTKDLVSKMSIMRNQTIQRALDGGYDYLLSADTDLVLHPQTLKVLLESGKDIVAELFWTNGWSNAWMYDQAEDNKRPEWYEPGLYEIGGSGALILISRKVLERGVDYTPIPNIRKAVFGEDRHFCIRAVCNGFSIWLDNHAQPFHLYDTKAFQEYMAHKGE